ncbi:hypothetical protein LBMAG42_57400 [Deltaproteobacteria bacterium]|nr:hypothetical protein LBMAG42_57400 [Deltaproteobacteria bacterium]
MSTPDDIDANSFWAKVGSLAGEVPFLVDVIAMYYAMIDDDTPWGAKCAIAGAIAYFILPLDAIPDFLFPMGYTDDAGVVAAALAVVRGFVTDAHYRQAREFLGAKR